MSSSSNVNILETSDEKIGEINNHPTPPQVRKPNIQYWNDQYSPLLSQYTQEETENVDVVWDWYSPQSKPRFRKHKRSDPQNSPKLTIKRQPSNDQLQVFNKLKVQLETFTNQVSQDTHKTNNKEYNISKNVEITGIDDIFNDSMDEQLFVCSQEVEHNLKTTCKPASMIQALEFSIKSPVNHRDILPKFECSKNLTDEFVQTKTTANAFKNYTTENNSTSKYLDKNLNKIEDDSFDFLMQTMKDEDLELNTPVNSNKIETHNSSSQPSYNKQHTDNPVKPVVEGTGTQRTEPPSKSNENPNQILPETLAESPVKCTPEEIMQKRLQALAKLAAKKRQDIIERNRQQALKRLEENRRKRILK